MGKMINLLSNDLDKFNYVCIVLPFLWIGPIQTIVSIYLLWPILGRACFGSILVLLILTPIQFYLSRKFASFRRRIAAYTDERIRLLNETITSLKLIKLYGWEYPFQQAMAESRRRETDLINRVGIIKGISVAFMYVSSKLVLFVTIIFHCLLFGESLDPRTLFMSMAMLNNVQFTMTQLMPRVVSLGVESLVSLRRIGDFLLTEELSPSVRLRVEPVHKEVLRSTSASSTTDNNNFNSARDTNKLMPRRTDVNKRTVFVECYKVGASWPNGGSSKTIDNISFRCESPGLVIICGQVASGKSSLLMSLLNELLISEGRAQIQGSYGYCSQTAWIFNGTVRDNIVFGLGYNEKRYEQVVEICALKRDMDLLEHGDLTYIQENSLSGGQKARVSLARCLYRDSDIYLLDDPFSAIDGRVAKHIFEEAIKKFLSAKLVLLATHQVKLLKQCNKVLLLDQGKQLAYCSYTQLRSMFSSRDSLTNQQLERLSFLRKALKEEEALGGQDDNTNTLGRNDASATGGFANKSVVVVDDDGCGCGGENNIVDIRSDEYDDFEANFLESAIADAISEAASIERSALEEENGGEEASEQSAANKIASAATSQGDEGKSSVAIRTSFALANAATAAAAAVDTRAPPSTLSKGSQNDDQQQLGRILSTEKQQQLTNPSGTIICLAAAGCNHDDKIDNSKLKEDQNRGEPTSESIHAPYGFSNYRLVGNGEKTLITAEGPDGQACELSEHSTSTTITGIYAMLPSAECPMVERGALMNNNNHCTSKSSSSSNNNNNNNSNKEEEEEQSANKVDTATSGGANSTCSTVGHGGSCCSRSSRGVSRRTMARATSHYRTTMNKVQHHEDFQRMDEGGVLTIKNDDSAPATNNNNNNSNHNNVCAQASARDNFQSQNGPVDEERSSSSNKLPGLRVWYKYYTQTSVIRFALIILTFLITQALFSTVDIYLTVWSLIEQNKALVNEITGFNHHQLAIFKHEALVGSSGGSGLNKTNIIDYDLTTTTTMTIGDLPPSLLMSFPSFLSQPTTLKAVEYNCTNNEIEMVSEIQKVSISPLSSRSSHHHQPFVLAMNNFFVPMVDLFYTAPDYPPSNTVAAANSGQRVKQKQDHRHQITSSTGNEQQLALADDLSAIVPDRDIFEESEAALNVKSIYRPLYWFVNNFTSGQHALTYTILLMALFSCSAITNVLSLTSSNKSAISLYRKLTDNALFAKLAFFDQNPAGRFLNRATRDTGIIDEAIPYTANQAYDALLQTAATFIIVAAVDIQLALPSLIILFIFLIFHSIHVKPTKDIQRLEGISRSPIISHISTTLAGLHTIRATKSEHRFEQLFMRRQDAHTSIFLLYLGCNRTMAVVLDSLNATYTGIIALWAVVSGLSGPSAGLIITSAMLLSGLTQHGVMKLTETESLMTSVERVIEYCSLPQEENYDRSGGQNRRRQQQKQQQQQPNCSGSGGGNIISGLGRVWPKQGSVEYKHVDLYYNRLEKPVLKNISFKLNAGEKVGIVGRTGAGKSSIITTLFRLYEFDGTILIDGLDIKEIDLIELRTAIGIIPQEPVLFCTSIRQNLDPLNVYNDYALWAALDKAHLRETVSALPGKLDYDIGSGAGGGCCFSSGQKQLICLARVLLRQSPLIVMDEATANVDPTTDAIIQATIRREFKHCTVITIAHRLETILDCDRIMVLEAGRIVDFDTPEQLAAKSNSYFAKLLRKSSEE